jgi:hypothetical protein
MAGQSRCRSIISTRLPLCKPSPPYLLRVLRDFELDDFVSKILQLL